MLIAGGIVDLAYDNRGFRLSGKNRTIRDIQTVQKRTLLEYNDKNKAYDNVSNVNGGGSGKKVKSCTSKQFSAFTGDKLREYAGNSGADELTSRDFVGRVDGMVRI